MPRSSSISFFSPQPRLVFSPRPRLWITVDKWVSEPLRLAGSGPHNDDGVAARGESLRSRGGLAVAGEASDPYAVHRASTDVRPLDARPSTCPTKFALERGGSLFRAERPHLDRIGAVARRRCRRRPADDAQPDWDHTLPSRVEDPCGSVGEVEDAPAGEGSPVVDPHLDGAAVVQVLADHPRA